MVVTGEAGQWGPALSKLVGSRLLHMTQAADDRELLDIVGRGRTDLAVIDEEASSDVGLMRLVRIIRRLDEHVAIVLVTNHTERRWLEDALELAAFSVLGKPLQFEALLRQLHGVMVKLNRYVT